MISIATDVQVAVFLPRSLAWPLAFLVIDQAFAEHGAEITGGTEGKHSRGSKHYSDDALDFRTRHVPVTQRRRIASEIRRRLAGLFDVVLHKTHLHVEYHPKRGPNQS